MRKPLLILAILAGAAAAEARPGTATKYRPANLFGGYRDRIEEPGLWRVDARSNGVAGNGFAQNMAAYRAADILREGGFEYMQVINQKGQASLVGVSAGNMHAAGESMTLWVRGAHDAAPPTECRAKSPSLCFTVPVARTMDRIRPLLTFPDDGS